MGKCVTKYDFQTKIRPKLKKEGKTIALCHGVFDLIHPGHIIHFEQAKEMADVLVVSITDANHVRKGPGRPYFDDEMRMKELSSIEYIDYVIVSNEFTVDDIVEAVEPDIYVKGVEYKNEDGDITENMRPERELVEKHGGKVAYTGGQVFSSTKLINTGLSGLSNDVLAFMQDFKTRYSIDNIISLSERLSHLKVLVVGDLIIDKYTYCDVVGLMSKDMAYSSREKYSEEYFGGSAAIARHLSSFCNNVSLMSVIGSEDDQRLRIYDSISENIQLKLISSKQNPTIVKHRFLSKSNKREEYRKIFSVTNIKNNPHYEDDVYDQLLNRLDDDLKDYDVIFLCDFGHGMVNKEVMDKIQEEAKYLVLNCQTNSTNKGLNPITKYLRADAFALDQGELKLAFPGYAHDEKIGLEQLSDHLGSAGWLTRGSEGACGISEKKIISCPAFTLSVKDTVGAGDAFYSVAGIYSAAGADNELSLFMGNIAGALGANIVGNKDSIQKVDVLKYASTLLNV